MVILTAGSFVHFLVLIIDCSICGSHALELHFLYNVSINGISLTNV